jgi:uncharacterized membrane protein
MKTAWTELSTQIEKQKQLTDKLIMTMTEERYKNKLSKIHTPELIATFVSIGLVILIAMHYQRYDTPLLKACAIFSTGFFIIMPILSLRSIRRARALDILNKDHKQVIAEYARAKQKILSIQKLSFYLSFILMIAALPVMLKIMAPEKSIKPEVWYWYLPITMALFIYFAKKYVYGYYARVATQAGDLIKEIEDGQ